MKKILFAVISLLIFLPSIALSAVSVSSPIAAFSSSTDTNIYAMGAYTPTANTVQVVYVQAAQTVAAGDMTGGSLTWIMAESVASNGGVDTGYLFYTVVGSSPVSTNPTFDCTGDNASGVIMLAFEISGVNLSNPLRQIKSAINTSSNPTITMDSSFSTNSAYIYGVSAPRNPASYTPPGSWTEPTGYDTGHTSPARGAAGAYRAGGETGSTVTITGSSANWGLIVAEFCEASECIPPVGGNSLIILEDY